MALARNQMPVGSRGTREPVQVGRLAGAPTQPSN